MKEREWDKLLRSEVLEFYGIPYRVASEEEVDFLDSQELCSWDGGKLLIDETCTIYSVFHELAHWIVASAKQRLKEDFGLDVVIDIQDRNVAPTLREELAANCLGLSIQLGAGFEVRLHMVTPFGGGWWSSEERSDFDQALFELGEAGFLSDKYAEPGAALLKKVAAKIRRGV